MNLKKLRAERGWTQLDLAIRSQLSPDHISKIENMHYEPKLTTLQRIAKAFKISLSELLDS